MMIGNGQRFASLDGALDELTKLSERELEDLREKHSNGLSGHEEVDLEVYRDQRRERQRSQSREEYTLLARVKRAMGFTPEREFEKRLGKARSLHAGYERMCEELRETVGEQSERVQELSRMHLQADGYFKACQEHYSRKRERVDRLEAELEALSERTGGRLTSDTYPVRDQLIEARSELGELEHETNGAYRTYRRIRDQHLATEEHQRILETRLSEFDNQRTMFGVLLDRWENERSMSVGGSQPSMQEIYEELGVQAQRMGSLIQQASGSEASLDDTYAIKIRDPTPDPLEERWLRMRDA